MDRLDAPGRRPGHRAAGRDRRVLGNRGIAASHLIGRQQPPDSRWRRWPQFFGSALGRRHGVRWRRPRRRLGQLVADGVAQLPARLGIAKHVAELAAVDIAKHVAERLTDYQPDLAHADPAHELRWQRLAGAHGFAIYLGAHRLASVRAGDPGKSVGA